MEIELQIRDSKQMVIVETKRGIIGLKIHNYNLKNSVSFSLFSEFLGLNSIIKFQPIHMGHLSALLRKNWILWKRNCFCSCCELFVPILLIFALMAIRYFKNILMIYPRFKVAKTNVSEKSYVFPEIKNTSYSQGSYDEQLITPSFPQLLFGLLDNNTVNQLIDPIFNELSATKNISNISDLFDKIKYINLYQGALLQTLPRIKDCKTNKVDDKIERNGLVALAGDENNAVIKYLKYIFENYYLYNTKIFNSTYEIDDYVRSSSYWQNQEGVCFGVAINKYDVENAIFDYELRFNVSFNGQDSEIPLTSLPAVDPIKFQDQTNKNQYWASGMLTLQNWIDNIILKERQHSLEIQPYFSYIYRGAGLNDLFPTYLKGYFGIYLVLPLMIIYLRMTYQLIFEKEKKLREGMKMMGLDNSSFYLSWIIQYVIIYTFISIIATILLSKAIYIQLESVVFQNTDGFILFLNYWLFCMVILVQSLFISVFFTRALFGLIVAILWYLLMYLIISLVGTNGATVPVSTLWAASLSSHSAISFSFDVMSNYETQSSGVTWDTISTPINNYSVSIAFTMHIINIIFYSLAALYLDLVFPNEWGKKKHPLFFITYFNRPHQNKLKVSHSIDPTENQRFEDVDQALKDQETRNEVVKIQGLSKIYPNGKVAVKNINLTMYSGQIYALLGHNGAGKTSTISMLTGLLDISQGSATSFGFDLETQIDDIRKFMGVCPQHDILFDMLTVKEHLEIFAVFKGMKADDIPAAVRRMIEDVDLLEKTDYLAKNLSGGQKRRLSVAIAFIGNSKLIYLDEPTSGMDTSARRYIWEMLKNYKEDRVIVLTTHFMDEADFLGDRIGIMGEGKLICSGSSVFLKNQFGAGYNLTIVKQNTTVQSEPICQLVTKLCPEALILSKVSAEILVQLPMGAIKQFQTLFEGLDQNLQKLQIQNYGISITTLEEVFLKVAKIGAGHQNVNDYEELEQEKEKLLDDFDLNSIRVTDHKQLFLNHTVSLLLKRIRIFRRDYRSLACEIFLPCIVVAFGLALMTIQFISDAPSVTLIPSQVFDFKPVYFNWFGNDTDDMQIYQIINNTQNINGTMLSSNDIKQADYEYYKIFKNQQTRTNIGWYSMNNKSNSFNYTFFVNSIFRDGPLMMLNLMNKAIIQMYYGQTVSITVKNNPLVRTEQELSGNSLGSGFIAALICSIGMAFIPSSVVSFIVKEREINIKHQQLVSGVSVKAYWFSNWVMDVGKHIVPSIICCLLILAFDISILSGDDNYGFMWLIFFLYGWAIIPFCYLCSFLFRFQGNALLVTFFFNLFSGSILSIIVFILRLIESTRSVAKGLAYIFRLIPSFSFAYGILGASSKSTYKIIEGWTFVKSTWDIDVSGLDVIYLSITGLIYLLLVFVVEYFEDTGDLQRLGSNEGDIPYLAKELDSDVKMEAELCETLQPQDRAVLVKNLRKVFMLDEGRHKVAVDKVSFQIENGEVFGLLGVNGAGKTTTFKILSGEIKPTSGDAWVSGKSVTTEQEQARYNIGYCPQFDGLLENLTVREHIELFSDIKGVPKFKRLELVNKKLQEMDLERFENIQSGQLSGGNKRKLSVAIAMIGNPPIVFLDEPSTGMDPEARRFMWNVISRIATKRKQSTIILTTHSMEEAEALSTKIAIQVEGNLRCIGSVQHIKSKFGRGYEVEVKLEKPTQQEVENLIKFTEQTTTRLNMEQTIDILKKVGQQNLEKQINMKGFGSHIFNDLRKPQGLSIETLMEFIIIEQMGTRVQEFIKQETGNFEIIEHFQSFYRFRINSGITVGKLFQLFEQHKSKFRISQYSIRQASIEQIFNEFATQVFQASENKQMMIPPESK